MAVQQMTCTGCGAEANASCNCGKPYVPKKQRATDAIKANPRRSNVDIAEELGVDEKTVRNARQEAGSDYSDPEREGRDGKVYRLPVRDDEQQMPPAAVVAIQFKVAAEDLIEAAHDALGFVGRMEFSEASASACIGMVDQVIAEWSVVKSAIQKKGEVS